MREFLTAAELAERLRVRPSTIRTWGRVGLIPVVRLSPRALRFDFDAVVKSLTRHREKGTSPPTRIPDRKIPIDRTDPGGLAPEGTEKGTCHG